MMRPSRRFVALIQTAIALSVIGLLPDAAKACDAGGADSARPSIPQYPNSREELLMDVRAAVARSGPMQAKFGWTAAARHIVSAGRLKPLNVGTKRAP